MDLGLRGKVAIVTAATANIGRGIALELASEGAIVVAVGRDADAGEAVVADDPAREGELGSFVMVYATDSATLNTDFCIFDAADVTSGPLARVHLPRRVPAGFHGNWMPGVV